jgi:hypothetical protein
MVGTVEAREQAAESPGVDARTPETSQAYAIGALTSADREPIR